MYISDLPAERLVTVSIPAAARPPARPPAPPWPHRLAAALARWNAAPRHNLDEHLAADAGFDSYEVR
jgi:hypothetical protein